MGNESKRDGCILGSDGGAGLFNPDIDQNLRWKEDLKPIFSLVNMNSKNPDIFRWALGWEVKASKHLSFETYYVHQFEGSFNSLSVNAVGLALKVYFIKGDFLGTKSKKP